MRDIRQLHPDLQVKINELIKACKKAGIRIGIGECLRTVAEQDAFYAKGRTRPGIIVTNAKGSTYSSMHQWGIAFDFYLIMDVDKDGSKSDDAFNNATGLFNKVGAIGKKLGLEWGGNWTSINDLPHFQLPNWGSTAKTLKNKYGNPEAFKKTWTNAKKNITSSSSSSKTTNSSSSITRYSKSKVAHADKYNKTFAGTYKTSANLNLRTDGKKNANIIITIPKGKKITCYGYYSKDSTGATWYYVEYGKYTGYVAASYCQKSK